MKIAYYFSILCVSALLVSCFPKDKGIDAQENSIDSDTATAASAPVIIESDTTLQPIIEITLKAIGNKLEEMRYDQDTLIVKSGARIKLTLVNEGIEQSMIHNVVFTEVDKYKLVALAGAKIGAPGNYVPDSPVVIAATPLALPGQTVELEFNAPLEIGTYHYVCTYPGHWKKMNGYLIVKGEPFSGKK